MSICFNCGAPLYNHIINIRANVTGKRFSENYSNMSEKDWEKTVKYFELLQINLCCRQIIMTTIVPHELLKKERIIKD